MINLRLLGGVELRGVRPDGTPAELTQPKRLALLAYLALAEPAGLHSRDRLLALLWPDADEGSSRHSLRNALHAIRQALGEDSILTRGEGWVGLDFDALRCDVLELRTHLAASRVDEALALWAGDLAPGFHLSGAPDFDRWLEEQRRELSRAVRKAAWNRAHELEGAGMPELEAVRRAVRLDPGNEPGARRLMQLLAAAGDRSGALRAYQEVTEWLAQELEVDPSAETRALAERLRVTEPTGSWAPPQPVASRSKMADAIPAPTIAILPRPRLRRWAVALALAGATALVGMVYPWRSHETRAGPASEAELAVLRLPARYRTDTAAYSSYLRGLTLRFEFHFIASRDTLAELVNRKPLYVPGLYGLAHSWIFATLNNLTDPDESWPRIDALGRRALALDSTAASAWLVLAAEDMFARPDLKRAGERITHARQLDPFDADAVAMRSVWFRFHGEMDSAVAEARLAHRLDPLSLLYERLVGKQLFFARRYDESRAAYLRMLQDNPGWVRGYVDLAQLSIATERTREAVHWLRLARAAEGDSAGAAALTTPASDAAAILLIDADARRSIARLDSAARAGDRVPAQDYASAFATLGDTIATLGWLDSMLIQRDSYIHQVRIDPVFDFLRAEPRYQAWESRSGLPPMESEPRDALAGRRAPKR